MPNIGLGFSIYFQASDVGAIEQLLQNYTKKDIAEILITFKQQTWQSTRKYHQMINIAARLPGNNRE